MKSNNYGRNASKLIGVITSGFLLISGIFGAQSAHAGFDRVFFFINGDSTISTMSQGDELIWGSTSDSGGTINWEIWYDANANSTIDPSSDAFIASLNITDGNPLSEENPILDGFAIGPAIDLSLQPGNYIFKATDIGTNASLQKVLTMVAMLSPPNKLTGTITVPGFPAPNSVLANRVIFAETDSGDEGAFAAITDNTGFFSINIGAIGTGITFYIETDNISGFSTPTEISAVASGVVANNDFTYSAAVDSVWGFVKDDLGAVINFKGEVNVNNFTQGFNEKFTVTENGRYAIYFSAADKGSWDIEASQDYIPTYLEATRFPFSHDTIGSFQHDIILNRTDANIFVKIIENGGLPVNNYLIRGFSQTLQGTTVALSGTGANNLATLSVSSMDLTGWEVSIEQFDGEFPLPPGLIPLIGLVTNVAPGDTVTLTLKTGHLISGTITQDPGDAPIFWDDVFVSANNESGNFNVRANNDGSYSLYTDTGTYFMSPFANGYITNPAWANITVTGSMAGPSFVINSAHAVVSGTLTNVTLPLDNSFHQVIAQTGADGTNGYYVSANVDSVTGTYTMNLSDGIWTITPSNSILNASPPAPAVITIGEPPDNAKTVDFAYTSLACCVGVTGNIDCDPSSVVDIADLTKFIDHLFISLAPLCCPEEGNIDGDLGGVVDIADMTKLIDHLFITLSPTAACQ